MDELSDEQKGKIRVMVNRVFEIIRKTHPTIRMFSIRFFDGVITVGGNVKSTYKPIYHDPENNPDPQIAPYLDRELIGNIFNDIRRKKPRIMSYLIHYNHMTGNICVRTNSIGSKNASEALLYNYFQLNATN
jgi:hypothetical protein